MRKILFTLLLALQVLTACKQSKSSGPDTIVTPTQLNVESLIDSLDLDMDISQLSVADLHILRHVFAARKGYPFRDSYLRSTYAATSWYDSLMWEFDGNSDNFHGLQNDEEQLLSWRDQYYRQIRQEVMALTPEQQAFVDRVKAREEELLKKNFKVADGRLVNVANIINPGLLKTFDAELQQQLGRNGFAIVPASHQQLFTVYEQNDYHQFPSFVTTDLYLQLYHLYFDAMLRDVEEHKLYNLLGQFCSVMRKAVVSVNVSTAEWQQHQQWLDTYFAVAIALLSDKAPAGNPTALHEYQQVMKSENNTSEFLGYTDVPFEYSLFRPRGHYTRNSKLSCYFRAMMWLQMVPFQTDREPDMERAVWLADIIGSNKQMTTIYKMLTEPLDWLMGKPDDVTIMQVWELQQEDLPLKEICKRINALAEKQTRLRPKHQHTSRNKVRLMPQRYQPDAEVLQEMVDYDTEVSKRPVPMGLDVFAAMGVSRAEKILAEELNEPGRWEGYKPMMAKMRQRMDSVDWNENVCNVWMSALKEVASPDTAQGENTQVPYFMLTPQWEKKSLNTALASWAELKHDAILYAKQPMGAECGGGGPPDPVVKGYVEPNVKFWSKAISLLQATSTVLNNYCIATERTKNITARIREMAEFLQRVSCYELAGNEISGEEYDQLKAIGAAFENMSLELISNPDQNLWEWGDVQGPERNVALIADVYTANADNNPQKTILYEGVGQADEIYVVVEIKGYLYLMRGGVFSYRELTRPYGEQRMNDEEWQKKLETNPRLGVPKWMEEIIVPLKEAPVDNEEVFYSSGC